MLRLVRCLFVISTSVIDCLGRFVSEMTYHVSSGLLMRIFIYQANMVDNNKQKQKLQLQ